ncbi:hypothetical protein Sm713_81100 [Streptomyces sp. TS71-3]|nr:hypothetical protein Sm713_81100 [Streptomyces sp. TS71-3]
MTYAMVAATVDRTAWATAGFRRGFFTHLHTGARRSVTTRIFGHFPFALVGTPVRRRGDVTGGQREVVRLLLPGAGACEAAQGEREGLGRGPGRPPHHSEVRGDARPTRHTAGAGARASRAGRTSAVLG